MNRKSYGKKHTQMYRKIPKISPGAYIFSKALFEGLIFEGGYLRGKICVSKSIELGLQLESKFTVFSLFYFVFEGNSPSTSPRGAYIWRGDLTVDFLRYRFWGGLFSEFYGTLLHEIFATCLFRDFDVRIFRDT